MREGLSGYMESQSLSYQTGILGSWLTIGGTSREPWGTLLRMNTMFHLHTDGQSERAIQVLEDMLQAFVMNYKDSGKGN